MGRSALRELPKGDALPELRSGFGETEARRVASALEASFQEAGLVGRAEVTTEGHAGGLRAIARAVDRLASGEAHVAAVVGVDSYLDADTLDALAAKKRLALCKMPGPPHERQLPPGLLDHGHHRGPAGRHGS